MKKIIQLLLIAFICGKTHSQPLNQSEKSTLTDIWANQFNKYTNDMDISNSRKIVNDQVIGINIRYYYDDNYMHGDKRPDVAIRMLKLMINKVIRQINHGNPFWTNQLKEMPLEIYVVPRLSRDLSYYKNNILPVLNNPQSNPELAACYKVTHQQIDYLATGFVSFTHTANWNRVNKIIISIENLLTDINKDAVEENIDQADVSKLCHAFGHILNENSAGEDEYWNPRSRYNSHNISSTSPKNCIKESTKLSTMVSNYATLTRKCFAAEVFTYVLHDQMNKFHNNIIYQNPNAPAAIIKSQYRGVLNGPVFLKKWGEL